MTQDEIIRMAREAGGVDITNQGWKTWVGTQTTEFLERFAALVAAHEREACAKVCDGAVTKLPTLEAADWVAQQCAAAIRSRGLTKSNTGE